MSFIFLSISQKLVLLSLKFWHCIIVTLGDMFAKFDYNGVISLGDTCTLTFGAFVLLTWYLQCKILSFTHKKEKAMRTG